jgi:hypothetical protein
MRKDSPVERNLPVGVHRVTFQGVSSFDTYHMRELSIQVICVRTGT